MAPPSRRGWAELGGRVADEWQNSDTTTTTSTKYSYLKKNRNVANKTLVCAYWAPESGQ